MSQCKSAYGIVDDLWGKYGEVAKKAGCTVAGAVTENPQIIPECIKAADKVENTVGEMIKTWNSLAGKSTWATLGARMLAPGVKYKGTLVSTSGRMFVSPSPCHFDRGRVEISETDGKAKTSIDICLMDPNGKNSNVGSYTLNENKAEKKDSDQTINKSFSGAMGKFVVVHLDAKSVANKFKYSIKLKEA